MLKLPFKFYGPSSLYRSRSGMIRKDHARQSGQGRQDGSTSADWTGAAPLDDGRNGMMTTLEAVNLEAATPVEVAASADVLFDLGLMFSSGSKAAVDLIAAHKWFNLAAVKGRIDALDMRREIAALMSEAEIAAAQRAARAWMATAH
jgi:TPR repeat protein